MDDYLFSEVTVIIINCFVTKRMSILDAPTEYACSPDVIVVNLITAWQPTPIFLPREFHGQRSLAGYSPWDHKELDTAEWLSTHIY